MKTALVTGISKGIGLALAKKLQTEGFHVMGTIYTGAKPVGHGEWDVFDLDLSSSESVARCAGDIIASGAQIDILINNAGALLDEDDTSVITDKLRRTLEINVIGTIDLTERLLPCVKAGGHIVNVSSTAASLEQTGHPGSHFPGHYPSYKISKAALNMYTRTLALRLKETGIVVSSAHPGWTRTDMGGPEADITPEEAAENIYEVAISRGETGQFWFKDKKLPW
ncbi:MAG: SDR family NAD(P)-dependent oxidoreductase [Candidatus Paceibacterota bacterium]|jgi:NAD(P)-dependent dehydrogenase (short-subunit alcohol dehydrogenase family)